MGGGGVGFVHKRLTEFIVKLTEDELKKLASVVVSGVVLDLMDCLPGFQKLIDKASRQPGYDWAGELDRITADTAEKIHNTVGALAQ